MVALVVTIVILLILSGITIAALTGDNGLIGKSGEAKNATEIANEKEELEIVITRLYDKRGNLNVSKVVEGINNDIKNLKTVTNTNGEFPVKVEYKNGHLFTISQNGEVTKIIWIDNDGSYKNTETGQVLNIGDRVKYEEKLETVTLTSDSQLIKDLETYSGNTDIETNTSSSISQEKTMEWKVLDMKDGKIRLISSNPTSSKIRLENYNGYNNAVYLLDEACDVLYSIKGIGKAQNLKIEDIQKYLVYDYTQYVSEWGPAKKYGETEEYTVQRYFPKIYESEIGCKAISESENEGNNLGMSEQSVLIDGDKRATSRLKVTRTYWRKKIMGTSDFIDSKYYSLFINNGSNYPEYWLSSRSVLCTRDVADFIVNCVMNGGTGGMDMYYSASNAEKTKASYSFRPVISLEENIQFTGNSINGWTIN